jgi:hypothetical protein
MENDFKSKLLGSSRVSLGGDHLLDRKAVQVFFGGTRPLHPSNDLSAYPGREDPPSD